MQTNTDQVTENATQAAPATDKPASPAPASKPASAADKPADKPKAAKATKPKTKPKAKPKAPRDGTKLRRFFDVARTAKGVDAAKSREIYGYDGGLWITIQQLATQFGLVGAKYQDGRKCSYRLLKPGQSTAKAKEVFKPGKAA